MEGLCFLLLTGLLATTFSGSLGIWLPVGPPAVCCFVLLMWLTLSSGITVGAVVVPQGMAYALLAQLPVQFGLYSSFMGVLIYWFFATSKDITIGVCCSLPSDLGVSLI